MEMEMDWLYYLLETEHLCREDRGLDDEQEEINPLWFANGTDDSSFGMIVGKYSIHCLENFDAEFLLLLLYGIWDRCVRLSKRRKWLELVTSFSSFISILRFTSPTSNSSIWDIISFLVRLVLFSFLLLFAVIVMILNDCQEMFLNCCSISFAFLGRERAFFSSAESERWYNSSNLEGSWTVSNR